MFFERKDRHVVPRWRDFKTTLALGELKNSREAEPISQEDKDAIARRVEEFRIDEDIWHAADLLSSAFVVGDLEGAEIARTFILANRVGAPKSLISLASGTLEADELATLASPEENARQRSVHQIRARLSNEPRNAILWVELSRLYAIIGDSRRALRSMSTAASLAPDSRFVVRSAARLFLHEHEAATALRVIRKAAGVKRDPWLLAAEIATASASGTGPLFAKIGLSRNDDEDISASARTELASALATLEMENGKTRKARQLFRRSLNGANENSVAQAEWANGKIGGLEVDKELLAVPRSFEASASVNFTAGEWDYAIAEGTEWLRDQPFSKRPAVFTSYVASLIEDYEKSISILEKSLQANPDDATLVNNLTFAFASANRLEEAEATFKKMSLDDSKDMSAITLAATAGLLLFREGQADRGREFYQLAVSRALAQGNVKYKALANLYLAREELIASTALAETAVNRALVEASRLEDDKEVALVAAQIRKLEAVTRSKVM